MKKFMAMGLVAFLLGGCASFYKKIYKKPKISYEGMQVEEFAPDGATVRLYMGIDNPNKFEMVIDHMDHKIFIEDTETVKTTIKDKVIIKPNLKTVVEFPLKLSFNDLKTNLLTIWKNKKIHYRVESMIYLKSAVGILPFQVYYKDEIILPPLPEISIDEIKVENMSFSDIDLMIYLKVENNDQMKISMKELSYDISLNNMKIAQGVMDSPETNVNYLSKENSILLKIPVKMKLLTLRKSITDILRKGEIQYNIHVHINGKSAYGEYILPLDKIGTTKIY